MQARIPGLPLPFTALLLAAFVGPAAADEHPRPVVTLVQAPGVPSRSTGSTALNRIQLDPAGKLVCPPGMNENVCWTLSQPLPLSIPRGGPVATAGKGVPRLSDQMSLQGKSIGR